MRRIRKKGAYTMKTKEQIFEFIKKRKVSFVSSVDSNGFPNMKAMLPPRKIDKNCFYFSTNTSSMRTMQYIQNKKASIYFYKKGLLRYEGIMLIGIMEVLTDSKIKEEIWHTGDKMYYKKGVTDPDYCVLKFTAAKGSYYCDLKTMRFDL